MKIGIFRREIGNLVVAIIHREGNTNNIEGYVYDLEKSYKGNYDTNIVSDFNIPLPLEDERVGYILDDLKEKKETLKYKHRVLKISNLLEKYAKEDENSNKIIDNSFIDNNILYYNGNIINLSEISLYDKDNQSLVINGIETTFYIPSKIMELIIINKKIQEF